MTAQNQLLREALAATDAVSALIKHQYTGTSIGMTDLQIASDLCDAVSPKIRAALSQPAEGGEVVAYRETITGRLCDPDDTHRRNYPMCYRPLTYADTATQADGSFTAGDVDAYCARARTETANECQQALQACIDAITAFQDPAENYPQDTQEFRDLDAAMKLAQQQISWIAPPASQEQAQQPSGGEVVKLYCETCTGTGTVLKEIRNGCWVGGEFECPDCNGNGYTNSKMFRSTPPAPKQPMTDQQINRLRKCVCEGLDDLPEPWSFRQGVRAIEAHHGITSAKEGGAA